MRSAVLGIAIAFLFAASVGTAAEATFKFAHGQPVTSFRHKSMERFKENLEKATSGRIAVEIYAGGTLGNESDLMDMVKMGTVQGTRGGSFHKASPKFLLYTLPFLFDNMDSVLKAMRSDFGKSVGKASEANGYYIPATGVAGGFRVITNNARPIRTPEDAEGLKLRTPPIETIVKTMQALGANPQSIPYGETYMALKMGVVDGQENPPSNIAEMKFYEAQKYLSLVNYQIHPDPFFVNLAWYKSLPADLQKAFNEAAVDAMEWSDATWLASEDDYLKQLKTTLEVNEVTPENRAKFVSKVRPVWDHYIKNGSFSQADIDSAIKAGK